MRANLLLICGALLGIILAASSLLENKSSLPAFEHSVAEVNGVSIPEDQYASITQNIASNKRTRLEDKDYDYILQKLIDEELLVQRGQELGFLQLNSVVRNSLTQAVSAAIVLENASLQVSDEELEKFYKYNQAFFQPAQKIEFQHLKFKDKTKADSALALLNEGAPYEDIKAKYSEKEIIELPEGLLTLNTIRQYLGPTLTEKMSTLALQKYSDIIEHSSNNEKSWYIFYIQEKTLSEAPAFATTKNAIRAEYIRQINEATIKDYIRWLRQKASIEHLNTNELKALLKAKP